jgi:hypothetical protein
MSDAGLVIAAFAGILLTIGMIVRDTRDRLTARKVENPGAVASRG